MTSFDAQPAAAHQRHPGHHPQVEDPAFARGAGSWFASAMATSSSTLSSRTASGLPRRRWPACRSFSTAGSSEGASAYRAPRQGGRQACAGRSGRDEAARRLSCLSAFSLEGSAELFRETSSRPDVLAETDPEPLQAPIHHLPLQRQVHGETISYFELPADRSSGAVAHRRRPEDQVSAQSEEHCEAQHGGIRAPRGASATPTRRPAVAFRPLRVGRRHIPATSHLLRPVERGVEPGASTSSSWRPRWTTRPLSRTMISPACRIVESRWAITSTVRSATRRASAAWIRCSASGSTMTSPHQDQDRGIVQQRPRDRDALFLPTRQPDAALADDRLVAFGSSSTNSCAYAARAAACTCASLASGFPTLMLAFTVSLKRKTSCKTRLIERWI